MMISIFPSVPHFSSPGWHDVQSQLEDFASGPGGYGLVGWAVCTVVAISAFVLLLGFCRRVGLGPSHAGKRRRR